jgi:hypothetical protein
MISHIKIKTYKEFNRNYSKKVLYCQMSAMLDGEEYIVSDIINTKECVTTSVLQDLIRRISTKGNQAAQFDYMRDKFFSEQEKAADVDTPKNIEKSKGSKL